MVVDNPGDNSHLVEVSVVHPMQCYPQRGRKYHTGLQRDRYCSTSVAPLVLVDMGTEEEQELNEIGAAKLYEIKLTTKHLGRAHLCWSPWRIMLPTTRRVKRGLEPLTSASFSLKSPPRPNKSLVRDWMPGKQVIVIGQSLTSN